MTQHLPPIFTTRTRRTAQTRRRPFRTAARLLLATNVLAAGVLAAGALLTAGGCGPKLACSVFSAERLPSRHSFRSPSRSVGFSSGLFMISSTTWACCERERRSRPRWAAMMRKD